MILDILILAAFAVWSVSTGFYFRRKASRGLDPLRRQRPLISLIVGFTRFYPATGGLRSMVSTFSLLVGGGILLVQAPVKGELALPLVLLAAGLLLVPLLWKLGLGAEGEKF